MDPPLNYPQKCRYNAWLFKPPSVISAGFLITNRLKGNQQTFANNKGAAKRNKSLSNRSVIISLPVPTPKPSK